MIVSLIGIRWNVATFLEEESSARQRGIQAFHQGGTKRAKT
jgi:hypothetical protein